MADTKLKSGGGYSKHTAGSRKLSEIHRRALKLYEVRVVQERLLLGWAHQSPNS
jgi:hypothetical protein